MPICVVDFGGRLRVPQFNAFYLQIFQHRPTVASCVLDLQQRPQGNHGYAALGPFCGGARSISFSLTVAATQVEAQETTAMWVACGLIRCIYGGRCMVWLNFVSKWALVGCWRLNL